MRLDNAARAVLEGGRVLSGFAAAREEELDLPLSRLRAVGPVGGVLHNVCRLNSIGHTF